jgi:hypothetical protein
MMGTMEQREERLAGIQLQSSVQGSPLPLVLGTQRVPANLIYANDFRAIEHREEQGGKGGGVETVSYTYTATLMMSVAASSSAAPIVGFGRVWRDKDVYDDPSALGMDEMLGTYSQTAWSYLTSNHPADALAYRGIAHVRVAGYGLGRNASVGNHSFEVIGPLRQPSKPDCDPADVLAFVLTDADEGAGYPSAKLGDWSQYSDYCRAAGILISLRQTTQESASSIASAILAATNADPLVSQGVLKILPRADQSITGNGVTYTPDNTPAYSLDDDDFLYDDGEPPVRVERLTPADASNLVRINYSSRARDYNTEPVDARDQAAIEQFGERPAQAVDAPFLCTVAAAQAAADALLRRHLFVRNKYRFRLGARYALLDPGDIVQITEPGLGMTEAPVRIVEIEEQDDEFAIVAEDYPFAVGGPAVYPSQAGSGYLPEFNAAAPDCAAPVVIELPVELAAGVGVELAIAIGSAGDNWGGAQVWISNDGSSYRQLGTVRGNARFGALQTAMTSGSTTADVLLDVPAQLQPGSPSDAANLVTLCWIGGEYVAYQGATLTAPNRYTLGSLVRGAYGTPPASHAVGADFVRVDAALLRSGALEPADIGRTVYIKLCSFNIFGGGLQSLADVDAHVYTITGAMYQLPPADVADFAFELLADGTRRFTWDGSAQAVDTLIEIRYGADGDSWDDMAANVLTRMPASAGAFESNLPVLGNYDIRARYFDVRGNPSAGSTLINADFANHPDKYNSWAEVTTTSIVDITYPYVRVSDDFVVKPGQSIRITSTAIISATAREMSAGVYMVGVVAKIGPLLEGGDPPVGTYTGWGSDSESAVQLHDNPVAYDNVALTDLVVTWTNNTGTDQTLAVGCVSSAFMGSAGSPFPGTPSVRYKTLIEVFR